MSNGLPPLPPKPPPPIFKPPTGQPRSILESGLAHAQELALMPADADVVIYGVKEGEGFRAGVAIKAGEHWTVGADLGWRPTQGVDGRIVIVGKDLF